ncbi:MAG TPA: PDZ domain-containing protein [Phycisphaerales bacterium]|nr:PDZ domain-containing protein [Phycisphaerales bacterium]
MACSLRFRFCALFMAAAVLVPFSGLARSASAQATRPTILRTYKLPDPVNRPDPQSTQSEDQSINPATMVSGELLESLRLLESSNYETREEAIDKIVELCASDQSIIYTLLDKADLSPEQRERLLICLRRILLETPRGALGIQMGPGLQGEVVVTRLLPGMPAEKVLHVDDRIQVVNNRVVNIQSDLISEVQSLKPGDKVHLMIRRARVDENGMFIRDKDNQIVYDNMSVDMELGSTEQLSEINNRNGFALAPNPITNQREAIAQTASRAYGVRPQKVPLGDGLDDLVVKPHENAPVEDSPNEVIRLSAANHPFVRQIREEKLQIARGVLALTPELRTAWQNRLELLTQAAEDRSLDEVAREQIKDVLAEYLKEYKNGPR